MKRPALRKRPLHNLQVKLGPPPMQQLQEQVDKLEDQIKKERCAHKKIELVHRELELKKVRAGQFADEGCQGRTHDKPLCSTATGRQEERVPRTWGG